MMSIGPGTIDLQVLCHLCWLRVQAPRDGRLTDTAPHPHPVGFKSRIHSDYIESHALLTMKQSLLSAVRVVEFPDWPGLN